MEYLVGVVLALGISSFATAVGLDRDGAFYPTLTFSLHKVTALFSQPNQALQS